VSRHERLPPELDTVLAILSAILATLALVAIAFLGVRFLRRAAPPPEERRCGTCAHFDLELGQQVRELHVPFREASNVIPPWKMGRVAGSASDTNSNSGSNSESGGVPYDVPVEVLRLSWRDLGACVHPSRGRRGMLLFPIDSCDDWEPRNRRDGSRSASPHRIRHGQGTLDPTTSGDADAG
jgi:hypothetical protein